MYAHHAGHMAPGVPGRNGSGRGRGHGSGHGLGPGHGHGRSNLTSGAGWTQPNPTTFGSPSAAHSFVTKMQIHSQTVDLKVGHDNHICTFQVLKPAACTVKPMDKARAFDDVRDKLLPHAKSLRYPSTFRAISDHFLISTRHLEDEAGGISELVSSTFFDIANLTPLCFLDSKGATIQCHATPARHRMDISYVRMDAQVRPGAIDQRLANVSPLEVSFLLKLPQTASPASAGTPAAPRGARTIGLSPQMQRLSQPAAPAPSTSYYGKLNFDSNQTDFDTLFGNPPPLFKIANGTSGTTFATSTATSTITAFADQCKLEFFVHALCLDYVGIASVDKKAMLQETVRALSDLKLSTKEPNGMRQLKAVATHYDEFNDLIAMLPKDFDDWKGSVNLPLTYWNTMPSDFQQDIQDAGYSLPANVTLVGKADQMKMLRELRQKAGESEQKFEKEQEKFMKNLSAFGLKPRGRVSLATTITPGDTDAPSAHNDSAHSFLSPAEQVLQRYNLQPVTNVQLTKDGAQVTVLSDFNGCLACFKTSHQFKQCPLRHDPQVKQLFHNNLNILKPNRQRWFGGPSQQNQQQAVQRQSQRSHSPHQSSNPRGIDNRPD